jgi:hypothetical protein
VLTVETIVQSLVSGLLTGLIYALIAVGLSLIFGLMDVVNFAHGEFLMMAMYATFGLVLWLAIDPVLAAPLVAALLFTFGALVYVVIIRQAMRATANRAMVQIFATFGLAILMRGLAQLLFTPDYRSISHGWTEGRNLSAAGIFLPMPQSQSAGDAPLNVWYHALNNGFKVPVVGGEDSISNLHRVELVASVRSYFYLGQGNLSWENVMAALLKGRGFVTNGPLIEFTAGQSMPGDEIHLPPAGDSITFRSVLTSIAPIERFELVRNGKVLDATVATVRTPFVRPSPRRTASRWSGEALTFLGPFHARPQSM